jgi:hypothetical protein
MNDQQRLSMAKTFKELSTNEEQSYWAGYMRGIRRKMHGEDFRTDEEDEKYLAMAGGADPNRDALSRGYRDGLKGVVPLKEGSLRVFRDVQRGEFYAGAVIPPEAEMIGTVIRCSGQVGALVKLAGGKYVQINAGVIRPLDQKAVEVALRG